MDAEYSGLSQKNPFADGDDRNMGSKLDRLYMSGQIQPLVIQLDNANPQLALPFAGDSLYFDADSTGQVRLRFDTSMQRGILCRADSLFPRLKYQREQLLLSWVAQPGFTMIVWTGFGLEYLPPNQSIATIGSITNPIQQDNAHGASFVSVSALAANTPENILAAASNTGGVRVVAGHYFGINNTGSSYSGLVAKASAPVSPSDGESILGVQLQGLQQAGGTSNQWAGQAAICTPPRSYAANLRLDGIALSAEIQAFRSLQYTIK